MLREFAEFEKLSAFCEVTEENLREVMFGERAFVEALIAFDGDAPMAYAIFYPCFSSFRGQRGIYLEDIYVKPSHQNRGIGEILLREIAQRAKEIGAVRMDFQVLDWNENAIRFYKKLGAEIDESERHFKITNEAFEKLCSG
jgi:ribosomal protein S18 acetylase RimI-like enzyme